MQHSTKKAIERGLDDAIDDNRRGDFAVIAARVAYARLVNAGALEITEVKKERLRMALIDSGLNDVSKYLLG